MTDQESDPTVQTATPKGRIDTDVPMELTTGDFESVRPATGALPTAAKQASQTPQAGHGLAWLSLIMVLALAAAGAWFMIKIHLPLDDSLAAQADQLRRAQAEALELAAVVAALKPRLDQLESEVEEFRVAADQEKAPDRAPAPDPASAQAAPAPQPVPKPEAKPAPKKKTRKKKSK